MTKPDPSTMFSPRGLSLIRDHPAFDDVVHDLATASLAEVAGADETGKWMFRDLGRSSLYVAAVILDATPAGLTASTLAHSARENGVASRGRVMAFLRRAHMAGELTTPSGDAPWTRRRIILEPAFIERLRVGNLIYARAAAALFPEAEALPERLSDDAFFRRYMLSLGVTTQFIASVAPSAGPAQQLFLNRDRGMSMVFRWMTSQPRPRSKLLLAAPLSRSRLSAEFGVSRVHVNRLLADAAAVGLLQCPTPDRVVFSPAMSDEIEQVLLVTLQITRIAYLGADADGSAP